MATITVAPSMIRAAIRNNYYLQRVLFTFLLGEHKIAQDADGLILKHYRDVENSEMIYCWTKLMTDTEGFEVINVKLSESEPEELQFLHLSRATKGYHLAIVDTVQEMTLPVSPMNTVMIDNEEVELKNKDEAARFLNSHISVNMQNYY